MDREILQKILFLYDQQTSTEQLNSTTIEDNGRGFNTIDAPIMTSFAKQILEKQLDLSSKQYDIAKRILPKYHGQFENYYQVIIPELREFVPKKKTDGLAIVSGSELIFFPKIYPTTFLKEYGFRGTRQEGEFCWTAKMNRGSLNALLDNFDEITLGESVEFWLQEDEAKNEIVDEYSSTLLDFQPEAVNFLVKRNRVLLGLAPGLGKSRCAIDAALAVNAKSVLIICPLSLVRTWQNEIRKWTNEDSEIWHRTTWDTRDERWIITNYDTAVRHVDSYLSYDWDVMIIDESILCKNRKTKRVKKLKLLAKHISRVWLLSGSPSSKFIDDFWSQLNLLDLRRFSSYWKFTGRYCYVLQNQWGYQITGNKPGANKNLLNDLRDIYLARTQDQVLDLPDWIIEDMEISMSKSQTKMYLQMETEFLATLPDGEVVLAPNVLTQLLRLVQIASNPLLVDGRDDGAKWKAVPEIISYVKLPMIIWTNFVKTAVFLEEILAKKKFRVASLTGKTKAIQRQEIVTKFQAGELDILIAHPAVGKFGFTLTAARTALYLERGYNGDDYYQSLHRIRRIGTEHSPHVLHALAVTFDGNQTIDHVIHKVLEYKKNNSFALTTGQLREFFTEDK